MKEPHRKGIANRPDPESCAGVGNNAGEALTGAHAGQPSSSEITSIGVPTLSPVGEGHTAGSVIRELSADAAESKNLSMRGNSMHGNRETLEIPTLLVHVGRSGKAHAVARRVRLQGVGRFHSTKEAGEQSRLIGRGVRGGKGIDQGKRLTNPTRTGHSAGTSVASERGPYERQQRELIAESLIVITRGKSRMR